MSTYQKLKLIESQSPRELAEEYNRAREQLGVEQNNVHSIRDRIEGSYLVRTHFYGANIVTTDGNVYYAQKAAAETPTNDFAGTNGRLGLRVATDTPAAADNYSNVATPLAASSIVKETGYPRTNDPDSLNAVSNKTRKVTWKYIHNTATGNHTTIYGGFIHAGGDTPSGTIPLLCHFTYAGTVPFEKTSSDTLTSYVNHELLGS